MRNGASVLRGLEPRILKVLGHELRYSVYMRLEERPWSCKELADDLQEDVKRIYEAVGLLAKTRPPLVEVVTTEPAPNGGPPISWYQATGHTFDAEEWEAMPADDRKAVSTPILRTLISEIHQSLASGSFDAHPNRVLVRHPLETDDQGMRELNEITERAEAEVCRVVARTAERASRNPTPLQRVVVALFAFLAPPD